jgi:hypothetical protein
MDAPPDLVRTHDDARAVLTHAVPGAVVEIYTPRDPGGRHAERVRAYQLVIKRLGREVVCTTGTYVLPLLASRLADSARQAVDAALTTRKNDG